MILHFLLFQVKVYFFKSKSVNLFDNSFVAFTIVV